MNGMTGKTAATRLNWVQTSTDRPETVVLIHAVGHDLTYWDRQIEALQADYNVVAFDLPGHGRSAGEPADWSFDYAAATVAGLVERVSSKPVHLVGLSFGGMIAQVTALARPDLLRSLTLIGTASKFPEDVRKGMRSRAQTVRTQGMSAVLESSLARWFTEETRLRRPDIIGRSRDRRSRRSRDEEVGTVHANTSFGKKSGQYTQTRVSGRSRDSTRKHEFREFAGAVHTT